MCVTQGTGKTHTQRKNNEIFSQGSENRIYKEARTICARKWSNELYCLRIRYSHLLHLTIPINSLCKQCNSEFCILTLTPITNISIKIIENHFNYIENSKEKSNKRLDWHEAWFYFLFMSIIDIDGSSKQWLWFTTENSQWCCYPCICIIFTGKMSFIYFAKLNRIAE